MEEYPMDKIENIVVEMTRKELEERVIELTNKIESSIDVINIRELLIDFQYHRFESNDSLVRFEVIADKYLKSINKL